MRTEIWIKKLCGVICGGKSITPSRVTIRLTIIVTLLVTASVAVGVLIPGLPIGWSFGEGDLMTWFSFFSLLSIGFLSRGITNAGSRAGDNVRLWRLLSRLFFFLAFDELLRIHETLDRLIHRIFGIKETNFTDHLDDAIIVLYGLVGLFFLLRYWRESLKFLKVWPYFTAAVLFACGTEILDFLSGAKPFWLSILGDRALASLVVNILDVIEETAKTVCEVFFIGAFLGLYWPLRLGERPLLAAVPKASSVGAEGSAEKGG